MPRIPYAEPPLGPKAAEVVERVPLNVHRLMAHSEHALQAFARMGAAIVTKSNLDPVLKELAILRVGHMLGSKYETFQHERIARAVGMSEAQIQAARTGDASKLGDDEKLIIAFAEEMERGANVSEATFAAAKARFSNAELVDLGLAVGFYGLVSRFLNTFQVPVEADPVTLVERK